MNAFMYQAALYCERCGLKIRRALKRVGKAPEDPSNEGTYDSDDFPKGPFAEGGGEADSPHHCDGCGLFLENPLTSEGLEYVSERIQEWIVNPTSGNPRVLDLWEESYRHDGLDGGQEKTFEIYRERRAYLAAKRKRKEVTQPTITQ